MKTWHGPAVATMKPKGSRRRLVSHSRDPHGRNRGPLARLASKYRALQRIGTMREKSTTGRRARRRSHKKQCADDLGRRDYTKTPGPSQRMKKHAGAAAHIKHLLAWFSRFTGANNFTRT